MYSLLPGRPIGSLTSTDVSGRDSAATLPFGRREPSRSVARFRTVEGMAKEPSVEEAIEIANRIQADRITAIRGVGEARQNLADVREAAARRLAEVERENADQIAAAEREDVKRYSAAQAAGWSTDELRKIGYPEPDKKARVRKRQVRKSRAASVRGQQQTPATEGGATSASTAHDEAGADQNH